jgi:integrase
MSGTNHLIKRGEYYYFRARVPNELIEAWGRRMVSISLGTGDPKTAKERLTVKLDEFNREVASLRRQSRKLDDEYTGTVLHLSDQDIERLCLRYRASKLAEDEILRIKGFDEDAHKLELDILNDGGVDVLRLAYARGDIAAVGDSLNAFLRSINLRVGKGPYERLVRRFQQAEIEVYEALLQRRKGYAVDIPMVPRDMFKLDDVFKLWKNRKSSRPPKTVRAFEQAFEELQARCTATTAAMLSKDDAVNFRNSLISSHTCSRRTVAKHISFLRAAFECARKDNKISVNPFDGVEVELDELEIKERTRLPFTGEELKTIFTGEVYQPGFVPRKSLGSSQYWLPLLSLLHGARLEELAQLKVEDVKWNQEHGHYLHIRGRVKNASSLRQVPLHPEMARLGFLEHVESIKSGSLFPTLRADKYGKLGTTYSTWFGRYLNSLGITDPSRVFHSFRHTFVALCKQKAASGIPPEVREAMIGHTPTNEIAALYGDVMYPLEPMVSAMKHVVFKGLDLSHLHLVATQPA